MLGELREHYAMALDERELKRQRIFQTLKRLFLKPNLLHASTPKASIAPQQATAAPACITPPPRDIARADTHSPSRRPLYR